MTAGFITGAAWTAEENERLRAAYAAGGIDAAAAALPHRSVGAIYHRTQRMRIASRRRRWTARDDSRLRRLWSGELDLKGIAASLGRSAATTYWRAQKLGLPLGVPAGWEYLHRAAERCGFGTGQLRTILRAAGVTIRPLLARPSKRRGKRKGARRSFSMVWPADVDIAVADWLAREPIERAAKRAGVASETLRRRLKALGEQAPKARKHRWLVSAEQTERALGAKLVRSRAQRGRYAGASFVPAEASA
jgi:hypothetical protein